MLIVAASLKGFDIEATDGLIGTVSDFLFDDQTWVLRWLVVDTGTWLVERKVLIHPSAIKTPSYEGGRSLTVTLTREQIENSPDISRDAPVDRQIELNLYDYYGWSPLWGGGGYFGNNAIASPLSAPPIIGHQHATDLDTLEPVERDSHLRSITAATGYYVHATDGMIGHVENFLIDDAQWEVRYLIVDTRNLWPGRHVLISPFAVVETSWSRNELRLNLTRETIKASPPWEPADLINTEFAGKLHNHYNWPSYSNF
ncbi:PRC-barrel domain-containing protein [Acidisoma sp.]|uniref:PRC-barrel domain-containing protein n=1 Tax=Acidisoma sp. TaxID=1872115 RepID=UPI003AFF94CF